MNLVDIGANLGHASFEHDFKEVVDSALDAGLSHIIITGTDGDSSAASLRLSQSQPQLFSSTAGYHPHVADQFNAAALASIRGLVRQEKVVAIGETGLDFNRNFSSKDSQLQAFEQHLQLAAEVQKPLFLHQRDAHKEFLGLLQKYRKLLTGGVVHCFTDNEQALEDYLALDMYIGITGWICDERRGSELRSLLPKIPNDRLLIETDAPYLLPRTLSPKPKSRRNEPKYLLEVLNTVAKYSGRTASQLAGETSSNAAALFNIVLADNQPK